MKHNKMDKFLCKYKNFKNMTNFQTEIVDILHIKRGNYVYIKGHACKCLEIKFFKAGKFGGCKWYFNGVDMITGKKYEQYSNYMGRGNINTIFLLRILKEGLEGKIKFEQWKYEFVKFLNNCIEM